MWCSLVGEGKLPLFPFFVLLLALKMTQGRLIGKKSNYGIFQAKVLEWGAIGVVAISFSSCKQIIIFKNVSGVSWQHSGKNPPASARDMGLIPDP